MPIVPDIAGVHRSAEHVFANLDADARAAFNRLPDARQVVVLRALVGLLDAVKHLDGNEDFTNTVIVAVDSFAREATRPEIGARLPAVVEVLLASEGTPSPNVDADDEPASGRPSSRIFISHAGVDNVLAERVAKRLRTAGFASWYSERPPHLPLRPHGYRPRSSRGGAGWVLSAGARRGWWEI